MKSLQPVISWYVIPPIALLPHRVCNLIPSASFTVATPPHATTLPIQRVVSTRAVVVRLISYYSFRLPSRWSHHLQYYFNCQPSKFSTITSAASSTPLRAMFLNISTRSFQPDEDELDDRTMEAFINAFSAYKSPTRSRHFVRFLPNKEVMIRTPTFPGSSVVSALVEKALERSVSEISLSSADIKIWMSAPEIDTVRPLLSPISSPGTIGPPPSPPLSMTSDLDTEEESESETTSAINELNHYNQPQYFPSSPPHSIRSLCEPTMEPLPTIFGPGPSFNLCTNPSEPPNMIASAHSSPLPLPLPQNYLSARKQDLLTFLSQTHQTRLYAKSTLCLGCEYLVDGGPLEYPHHSFCAFKHDRLLGHSGGTFRCLQAKCGFETLFEGLLVEHCEEVHCEKADGKVEI